MIVKDDKKHVKCIYLMRKRNPFSLYVPFMIIYWLSERKRIASIHFYKCSKAISLVLPKFYSFRNGTQETFTCHFSLMTSRFNMAAVTTQEQCCKLEDAVPRSSA